MARLPEKLVRAPVFDSPLRRTADSPPVAVVEPVASDREANSSEQVATVTNLALDEVGAEELSYRVTVRFSQRQWEAVQTECCRLRILGRKINASALVRTIVDNWISGQ